MSHGRVKGGKTPLTFSVTVAVVWTSTAGARMAMERPLYDGSPRREIMVA